MKRVFIASVLLVSAAFAADRPRVPRAALAGMERVFDNRLIRATSIESIDLLGTTRAIYLDGYGTVFSAEINLAPISLTPINPRLTAVEIKTLHARKLERMPKLRQIMRDMMANAASALDMMPQNEQIVLAISLFYFGAENREGLPAQVVMQASRQILLDVAAKKAPESEIRVGEY